MSWAAKATMVLLLGSGGVVGVVQKSWYVVALLKGNGIGQ